MSVLFQKKVSGLHSEANLAIQRDALSKDTSDRAFVLQSTIDVWLARLEQLENECPSKTGEFKTCLLLSMRLMASRPVLFAEHSVGNIGMQLTSTLDIHRSRDPDHHVRSCLQRYRGRARAR